MFFHGATFKNTRSPTLNSRGLLLTSTYFLHLSYADLMWSLMVLIFFMVTWTNSEPYNFRSPTSSQHKGVLHLLPYKASYKAIPIVAWWLLLYVSSTNVIYSSYFPPNSSMHARNRSSKTWMTLSDWPSIWGWNAVLMSNLVPKARCMLGQSREVNLGSRFDIMDNGIPWSCTTLFIEILASLSCKHQK